MTENRSGERIARLVFSMVRPLYPRVLRRSAAAEMEQEFVADVARARRRGWWSLLRLLLVRTPADIVRAHRMCSGDSAVMPRPRRSVATLLFEARHAIKLFVRHPGFALISIGTVAVGVAGVSTVYSAARAVWFDTLPFPDSERLVAIWSVDRATTARDQFSIPEYMDYAERSQTLEGIGAYDVGTATLTGDDITARRLRISALSYSMLRLLNAHPQLGRVFREEEDVRHGPRLAVASHAFWATHLNSDSALGFTVVLDGTPHEVIGVLPPSFTFPDGQVDLWRPLQEDRDAFSRRGRYVSMVGRMTDEVQLSAVVSELRNIAADLEAEMPQFNSGITAMAGPLRTDLAGEAVPAILMLGVAVSILLLLGCANVANLLLARAIRRETEITVRAAIGASRGRLVSQLMVESVILFTAGGIVGLVMTAAAVRLIAATNLVAAFRFEHVTVDHGVAALSLAVAVGTGAVFGLAPALHARRQDLARALGTRHRAPRRRLLADALVVGQVSLAIVLATGSLLLARTVIELERVDPGFEYDRLIKADLQLPDARYPTSMRTYPDWPEIQAFYRTLIPSVEAVPGVRAAALGWHYPLERAWGKMRFSFDRTAEDGGEQRAFLNGVTPEYLDVVGIPLVDGRRIAITDGQTDAPVLMVNQAFVDRFSPGEPVLGRRISALGRSREIVGVIGNIRTETIDQPAGPAMYPPLSQMPSEWISLIVNAGTGETDVLLAHLRAAIWSTDPDLPLDGLEPVTSVRDRQLRRPRLRAAIIGIFAITAGLLCAIGVAGVLGYHVEHRRREIGIRMALGARRHRVVAGTVGRGVLLAAIGTGVGLMPTLVAARLSSGFLYGIEPLDVMSLVIAPILLVAIAALAATIPAVRASRIHPAEALS